MLRRLSPALAALALACSGTPKNPAETRLAAGSAVLEVASDGRTLTWKRGDLALLTFPADAFRLGIVSHVDDAQSYDPYWLETDDVLKPRPPDDLEWRDPKSAVVSGDSVTFTYDGGTATLSFAAEADGRVGWTFRPQFANESVAWVRLRARADRHEGFYGLGEWGDALNHRGHLRPMQMEADLSYESANTENHAPIPLLIGTRGWGLFVESRQPGLFDVARQEDDLVEVTYSLARETSGELRLHLVSEPSPLDVTRHYYAITGKPLLPAPWALGPWIWRNENRDETQVLDDVKHLRDLDLATSALWIDRPYATAVNTFDFKPEQFPDPPAMIDAVHAAGLRLALWHTPYVEDAAGELHRTAVQQGYFPPSTGLLLNNWGKPVDFTNPDAYAWWQGLVRRYTDHGIEGFKLDFAEDVVVGLAGARGGWKFHDGSDESTMHDGYQLLYHQNYAETLPKEGGFLLCRTARWGDQVHGNVLWPGDLDANFATKGDPRPDGKKYAGGLPASVILGLGLGPSGFAFYGADTGGYQHGPPKKEVYVRWFEQTALSTVMQVGDSTSQPVWEFTPENGRDEETLALYRTFVRLHLRLFPYEWTYAQRLPTDGRAIARPLGLAHPELGEHPDDEYLFGDSLLVAPVVSEGATAKSVLFPAGSWIDWFDGSLHEGGKRETVEAPLGKLPLYLRAGAIVPLLRPTIDTLAPASDAGVESYANDPGVLWVRIVPDAAESEFALFDGTRVTQEKTSAGVRITVTPGSTFRKGAVLELLRTPASAATVDGNALPPVEPDALETAERGFRTEDAAGGTAWVKLPTAGGTVLVK